MKRKPHPLEDDCLYNVSPQSLSTELKGYRVFTQGEELKTPSVQEIWRIGNVLSGMSDKLSWGLNSAGGKEFHAHVSTVDRTATFTLGSNPEKLTFSLLGEIQKLILVQCPQWRFVLGAHSAEFSIAIYSDQIVFPNPYSTPEEEVSRIRNALIEWNTAHKGDAKRQFDLVQKYVKSEVVMPPKPFPPFVIGAFSKYEGNPDKYAIWVVDNGYSCVKECWFLHDVDEFGYLGGADDYDILEQNAIHPLYDSRTLKKKLLGVLRCLVYDASKFKGLVSISNPLTGELSTISSVPLDTLLKLK